MSGRAGLLAIALLASCTGDELVEACGGERPLLEDCFVGQAFADCGGSGRPQFACKPDPASTSEYSPAICRWFTNGCVARDFELAPCSPGPLCCGEPSPVAPYAETMFTQPWGVHPWDTERATSLTVEIEAVSRPAPGITCSDPRDLLCTDTGFGTSGPSSRTGDTFVASFNHNSGYVSTNLIVELFSDGDIIRARGCRHASSDHVMAMCRPGTEPPCADRGRVSLDANPFTDPSATIHGEAELWFGTSLTTMTF